MGKGQELFAEFVIYAKDAWRGDPALVHYRERRTAHLPSTQVCLP
jgi:hypothetical protein